MPNTSGQRLKLAQQDFAKARSAYKIAQNDMSMPGQEKEQMAEQIIALADELVTVAVESVEGGGMTDMVTPEIGGAPQDVGNGVADAPSTDIPITNDDPDKKLNVAQTDDDKDKKLNTAKTDDDKNEVKEMRKELDAMKAEKIHLKLAQKYSELFPLALRTAKIESFMSLSEPTAILTARVDEATNILAKPSMMKIAQQEDSLFNFDDLDNKTNSNTLDTGAKI